MREEAKALNHAAREPMPHQRPGRMAAHADAAMPLKSGGRVLLPPVRPSRLSMSAAVTHGVGSSHHGPGLRMARSRDD